MKEEWYGKATGKKEKRAGKNREKSGKAPFSTRERSYVIVFVAYVALSGKKRETDVELLLGKLANSSPAHQHDN